MLKIVTPYEVPAYAEYIRVTPEGMFPPAELFVTFPRIML